MNTAEEFKKELTALLEKYNYTIDAVVDGSDLHGVEWWIEIADESVRPQKTVITVHDTYINAKTFNTSGK